MTRLKATIALFGQYGILKDPAAAPERFIEREDLIGVHHHERCPANRGA